MPASIRDIENLLDKKFDQKLNPIKEDISEINSRIDAIAKDLAELRMQFGYGNLSIIKEEDREEM